MALVTGLVRNLCCPVVGLENVADGGGRIWVISLASANESTRCDLSLPLTSCFSYVESGIVCSRRLSICFASLPGGGPCSKSLALGGDLRCTRRMRARERGRLEAPCALCCASDMTHRPATTSAVIASARRGAQQTVTDSSVCKSRSILSREHGHECTRPVARCGGAGTNRLCLLGSRLRIPYSG